MKEFIKQMEIGKIIKINDNTFVVIEKLHKKSYKIQGRNNTILNITFSENDIKLDNNEEIETFEIL